MTSRSLYFNMLKEDSKRRIWTLSLSMLAFLIVLPIHCMLRLDRMKIAMETTGMEEAQKYFAKLASMNNIGFLYMITIGAAIICALNGFYYIYSKSKVDAYHSIPVKREKLFFVSYLNGVLIFVVPYIINLILFFIVGAANGLVTGYAFKVAGVAFVLNLIGFLLIYSIAIIAIMLTGNLIVGMLGIAVFMFYGPVLLLINNVMQQTFFSTYYESMDYSTFYQYVSPLFAYVSLGTQYDSVLIRVIVVFIISVIAVIVGALLYKIRPSEAAGRSMAFSKSQNVIKFLITIPTAIVGGLLFMSMSETNSFAWMIFGIIFIGFLAHGIIEIIYHADFKRIIANKLQLGLCIAIALVIVGAVKMDVFHYDTYLPKESNIESVGISFDRLEPFQEYYDFNYEFGDPISYYSGDRYRYVSYNNYRLDKMKLSDLSGVYSLVQYANTNNIEPNRYIQKEDDRQTISFVVKYTLKSKIVKYRKYTVVLDDVVNQIDSIYADEGYKKVVYQVFDLNQDMIQSILYYNFYEGNLEKLKLTKDEMVEFINSYKKDLISLSGKELLETIPSTQISLLIGNEKDNIQLNYYVYPSFTNTISYLNSLGVSFKTEINPDNINRITITKYRDDNINIYGYEVPTKELEESPETVVFTDKEDIENLSTAIVLDRFIYGAKINIDVNNNYNVDIDYKYTGTNKEAAYLQMDKLSEEMKQKINMQQEIKQ